MCTFFPAVFFLKIELIPHILGKCNSRKFKWRYELTKFFEDDVLGMMCSQKINTSYSDVTVLHASLRTVPYSTLKLWCCTSAALLLYHCSNCRLYFEESVVSTASSWARLWMISICDIVFEQLLVWQSKFRTLCQFIKWENSYRNGNEKIPILSGIFIFYFAYCSTELS